MAEENARSNEFTRIKEDFVRMVSKDPKRTTFYVCKIIEVILCGIAIGLTDYPFNDFKIRRNFLNSFTDIEGAVVFTSLYGYIMVNVILFLSQLLGEDLPKKMLMIFSGVAAILCCAAGILLIEELNNHEDDIIPGEYLEQLLPSGVFALIAALTFALDTLLTFKFAS